MPANPFRFELRALPLMFGSLLMLVLTWSTSPCVASRLSPSLCVASRQRQPDSDDAVASADSIGAEEQETMED